MMMFSLNLGAETQGLETFSGRQLLGESLSGQVKGLMKKLKKALKKEGLFKRSDFDRLDRFIKGENVNLALQIIEGYELKGGRHVDKAAKQLKKRLEALTSQNSKDCPGSGFEQTEFFSTERAFAALQPNGLVVTWGEASFGGDSSEIADQISCGVTRIFSTQKAFAALKNDGSVVTWGEAGYGGDSTSASGDLDSGVSNIFSTQKAFAALKEDGSIVVWGDRLYGGEAAIMKAVYTNGNDEWEAEPLPASLFDGTGGKVTRIVSTASAFAAIVEDRQDATQKSVFAWGNYYMGGDIVIHDTIDPENGFFDQYANYHGTIPQGHPVMKEVSPLLASGTISDIFSTQGAFAVLKEDGSVVTWGAGLNLFKDFPHTSYGGNSNSVSSNLQGDVADVFSNSTAFAALKSNGSVVTWGSMGFGGDSNSVSSALEGGVVDVISNEAGFVAVKNDGSLVIWGGGNNREFDSLSGVPEDVVSVVASRQSFAAVQGDGSVKSWGEILMQSYQMEVLASGVTKVFANDDAFAALKSDGGVVTWGWENAGGDMPWSYNDYWDAWYQEEMDAYDAGLEPDPDQIKAKVIHHLYRIKSGVVKIASTKAAFVALKEDGTIVTWGDSGYGGDSSGVASLFGSTSN